MEKDSQANNRLSITPASTTPITPITPLIEGDKYNHLALYQQFEARNNHPSAINSYHNQFTYPNSYHHIVPHYLNQAAIANQQPAINSLNLFAPYAPTQLRVPSPVFAPYVANTPPIPNSLNIFGEQARPSTLENGSYLIPPPRPASTSLSISSLDKQLNRGISSLNDNLIDLDTSLDSFNSMSVADLFDPLYEKKIPPPPPPPVITPTAATQKPATPPAQTPPPVPNRPEEPKSSPVILRKNSTASQPSNRKALFKELPRKKERSSQIFSDSTDILKIIKLASSSEFTKFNQTINELRQKLAKQPEDLTSLITFNPVIECPIMRKINVKLIIRYNNATSANSLNNSLNSSSNLSTFDQQSSQANNKRYQVINLQVSVNASVETIVYDVLTTLNIEDLDTKKYLLKIHGLEEFLPVNSTLAELKYISDCLVENKDPVLVLTELKHANTDLTSRQNRAEATFNYSLNISDRMFRGETVSDLYIKMDAIMRGLNNNRRSLIDSLNEQAKNAHSSNQTDLVLSWLVNLREKIKGLVALLNDAMDDSVNMIIERLEMFEKQIKADVYRKSLKERQPLITSDDNYDYRIDKMSNGGSSKGDCYTTLNEFVTKTLLVRLATYMNSVFRSFYLPFRVARCKANTKEADLNDDEQELADSEKVETIQANEKFYIYFNGLSRLSYFLNGLSTTLQSTSELFLKFSLVYGTKLLDYVVIKLDKLFQRKLENFNKKCKIVFDRLDLCQLPRETYLQIQIYTTTINMSNANLFNSFQEVHSKVYVNNEQIDLVSSSVNKISSNMIDKCLAWTSKSIFDDHLVIPGDELILAFFEGEISQIISTTASNVFTSKSPLVQITFPEYDYNYVYPNTPSDCDCQLKDFHQLSADTRERLLAICNKNIFANPLTESDKEFINHHYLYLNGIPNALAKVFLSFPTWDFSSIIHFYAFLKQTDPLALSESLELLLSTFPDSELRSFAVRSLEQSTPETLALYLPQLLEAVKYEYQHHSQLACLLLTLAHKSISFAHRLYWQLEELKSRSNECMHLRYLMLSDALRHFFNKQMLDEIELEQFMVQRIDDIAARLKETKESEQLYNELDCLCKEWQNRSNYASCRLPYNISYCTREIDIKSCSIISSFTMPIKLVFKNVDPTANSFYSIYKIGDDLRQDMFVLQMINVMNQLWLMEDLDLNVLTFTVMQTGNRRGFIEMITNAETLKEIQKGAVKNAFKKSCISDWLSSHNPNQVNYKLAVENFTRSCAAYSVATYILGIGDRHNDNLMVKYTGHMFHIDFGKYLGDAQTFAGFKRDRTPFLFTFDMFYVINQAKDPSFRFQEFIDLCCKAFQVLRTNYHLLISLIQLMMNSGIPGLNHHAISYVYKNLMIEMSEDESSNVFKRLIHDSLSKFASINFAIHTMAQPKTVNSSNYFSFVTYIYNSETDGKILSVKLEKPVKSDVTSTDYYKCLVARETEYDNNVVYRTFEEFNELLGLLNKTFPTLRNREPPGLNKFKDFRGHERFQIVNVLVNFIMGLQPEIRDSDIVYTFFHSVSRDRKLDSVYNEDQSASTSYHSRTLSLSKREMESDFSRFDIKGQIKVKIKYKDGKFSVNCLQCRNLKPPGNQPVSSLKPYVKCYLKPDTGKITKRKVQALFNGANPIFHETMEYDMPIGELKKRFLELSVLNNKLNNKERIGSVEISLSDLNWDVEHVKWFDLK